MKTCIKKQNQKQNNKNTKNNPKTKQSKTKKKTTTKPKQMKNKNRKHKHTWTFQTQINKNEPPHKAPQTGKTNILTLLQLYQTREKQITTTLKPEKKNKQKHLFAMFKNNPQFFHKFSVFSTYNFCIATAVLCWHHYKDSVSENHSFSKTQLVKPTFSPM